MKMNKKLLVRVLFGCVLSNAALAEKITYDKAVESSKIYQDVIDSIDQGNDNKGLQNFELNPTSSSNKMGEWVKLGSSTMLNAGQYASVLAPSAAGKSCLKGEKGFIATTQKECERWNSGGSFCYEYSTSLNINNGFKAECR